MKESFTKNLLKNRSLELASKIDNARKVVANELLEYRDQFLQRNCPVCDNSEGEEKIIIGYECRTCNKCTLEYVSYVPNQKLLKLYYNDVRMTKHEVWKRDRKNEFLSKLKVINNLNIQGPVIELGAGTGQFVKFLNDNNFDTVGFEIDKESCIKAENERSVKVINLNIENDEFEYDNNCELFLMYEIIEHLINPKNIIEKVFSSLKNGGYLIITTPNAAGGSEILIPPETKGRFLASALYPPYHINAFSIHTLYNLLIDCGFNIFDISTPGKFDIEMIDLHTKILDGIDFSDDKFKELIFDKFQSILSTSMGSGHLQMIAQKPF